MIRSASFGQSVLLVVLWLSVSLGLCGFVGWDWLSGRGGSAFEGSDDTGYYVWLRSAVVSGDFDFRDDIASAPTLTEAAREEWLARVDSAGRVVNKYPPGWALLQAPAYCLGHWITRVTTRGSDGWAVPEVLAVWCSQGLVALVGMLAAVRLAGRFASGSNARLALVLVWLASPLLYYQLARFAMVHGALFSLTALLWWLAFRIAERRERSWEWWLLGACAGLLVALRPTAGAAWLWPAWVVWLRLRPGAEARPWSGAAGAFAGAFIPLALSAWAVAAARGGWFVESYPGEPFHWRDGAWWSVLFSPRHGVFHHHPFLVVGFAGLVVAARSVKLLGLEDPVHLRRAWLLSALLSCLLLYAVNAAWWCWWFGSSFGNRAFDLWWLVAVVGVAHLLERLAGSWRRWLLGCAAAFAVLNLLWLCAWLTHAIPRAEPVSYRDLASALFGGTERTSTPK